LRAKRIVALWAIAALALTCAGAYRAWQARSQEEAVHRAEHEQELALVQSLAAARSAARAASAGAVVNAGVPGFPPGRAFIQPPRPVDRASEYRKELDRLPDVATVAWALPAVLEIGIATHTQLRVIFQPAASIGIALQMQEAGSTTIQTMPLPHRITATLYAPSFDVQPSEPQEKEVTAEGTWDWTITPRPAPGVHLVALVFKTKPDDASTPTLAPLERSVSIIEPSKSLGSRFVDVLERNWLAISGASNLLASIVVALWLRRLPT